MQTLSRESFRKIQYVIQGQNYENIYARLVLKLPPTDSALFAKILIRGEGAEWVTEDNHSYFCFSDASPEEQELIAICLEERKAKVMEQLHDLPYKAELLTIPDSNQIFYSKDEMGNVSVKIAQWGFKLPSSRDDIDIISAIIAKPRKLVQSQVNVLVRYSDGMPADEALLNLLLFGSTVPFKTDTEGRFNLGCLINGKSFSICDDQGSERSFTVDPNRDLYEAEFPIYTAYDITVRNQENTPCANFNLKVDGTPMVTDEDGRICFEHVLLTPQLTIEVLHEETSHKETYTLSRETEGNHFEFHFTEKFFSSLDVQVRYDDGEGLPHFSLKVGMDTYETDEYGQLHIDGIEAGTTLRVADATECNHYVDVELLRGENSTELVLERPVEKLVRIHLQDRKGNPLQNLPIKLCRKQDDLEGTTDADGNVFFPASLFTDGEKIKLTCVYKGRMKLKMMKTKK